MPLVSVLTTAFNRENYIAQSIESVLASSFADFELVIVDDASIDKTVEIARGYEERDNRVRVYVNEKNLGDYPNRNKAASYAKGKYIKYLDSDDMLYPHGLDVMVDAMERFPDAGFGLASKPEDERPYPVCVSPKEIYLEHFNGYYHFNRAPGSAIINREIFLKEGGFSGERMVGDLELWLRLARKYPMVKFPMDLYWNRVHAHQEFNTGYAKKNYPERTMALISTALDDKECPLNKDEIEKVKKMISRRRKQNIIFEMGKKIIKR